MNFISYLKYCIKRKEKPSLKHYVECVDAIEEGKMQYKEWFY